MTGYKGCGDAEGDSASPPPPEDKPVLLPLVHDDVVAMMDLTAYPSYTHPSFFDAHSPASSDPSRSDPPSPRSTPPSFASDDMAFQDDDGAAGLSLDRLFAAAEVTPFYPDLSQPAHPQWFPYQAAAATDTTITTTTSLPPYDQPPQWIDPPLFTQLPPPPPPPPPPRQARPFMADHAPSTATYPSSYGPAVFSTGHPQPAFSFTAAAAPPILPSQPDPMSMGYLEAVPLRSSPSALSLRHRQRPPPHPRVQSRPASSRSTSDGHRRGLCRSPNPRRPRSTSATSSGTSTTTTSAPATASLLQYGIPVPSAPGTAQAWRCAYPACTSRAVFTRGCDLRKHFNRHSKHLFCRFDGCPQGEAAVLAAAAEAAQLGPAALLGGFSSKKDRDRHEAKHNPGINCEWRGPDGEECGRVFSRVDNMKDHVRRIHRKGA